jgi:hypothetical protein
MEWAVGKQGEVARPDTGKLMLARIEDRLGHSLSRRWGEADRGFRRDGRLLLSEGTGALAPPGARAIRRAITGGRQNLDIPPNSVSVHEAFHVMKQAGRIENFQPHMHLRGKAMSMDAILPDGHGCMWC